MKLTSRMQHANRPRKSPTEPGSKRKSRMNFISEREQPNTLALWKLQSVCTSRRTVSQFGAPHLRRIAMPYLPAYLCPPYLCPPAAISWAR